jgi:hypothetical protein
MRMMIRAADGNGIQSSSFNHMRRYQGERWDDNAQFCVNGHYITGNVISQPDTLCKFCATCGAETTTKCPNYQRSFKGAIHNVPTFGTWSADKTPPPYCAGCGNALPWTASRLQAAADLADLQDSLTDEEKTALKKTLNDLVADTPQTTLAAQRFKVLAAKTGKGAIEAFRTILTDIVSETAKKILFPS